MKRKAERQNWKREQLWSGKFRWTILRESSILIVFSLAPRSVCSSTLQEHLGRCPDDLKVPTSSHDHCSPSIWPGIQYRTLCFSRPRFSRLPILMLSLIPQQWWAEVWCNLRSLAAVWAEKTSARLGLPSLSGAPARLGPHLTSPSWDAARLVKLVKLGDVAYKNVILDASNVFCMLQK